MSSKTKIVVLRMKELIFTGICVAFGLLFVIILLLLFLPGNKNKHNGDPSAGNPEGMGAYVPGTYTTQLVLGNYTVDLEVIADETGIASITLPDLEESVSAMYPLLEPTLASISEQFLESGSLENIQYDDANRYTSLILLEALEKTLEKAVPSETMN